jgi:hypothetical protein
MSARRAISRLLLAAALVGAAMPLPRAAAQCAM